MPTFRWLPRFGAEFDQLTPAHQAAFLATVALFVEDLRAGRQFRKGLRVKGVRGAPGVFEMTWAPDGRVTFRYGEPVRLGDAHIIWRRIGTHEIFKQP
ncbi:MAG: hypothetical protein ACR2HY_03725 [Acidimicrobiales bacterium]